MQIIRLPPGNMSYLIQIIQIIQIIHIIHIIQIIQIRESIYPACQILDREVEARDGCEILPLLWLCFEYTRYLTAKNVTKNFLFFCYQVYRSPTLPCVAQYPLFPGDESQQQPPQHPRDPGGQCLERWTSRASSSRTRPKSRDGSGGCRAGYCWGGPSCRRRCGSCLLYTSPSPRD